MKHGPFIGDVPIHMVNFYSYVSLPEGNSFSIVFQQVYSLFMWAYPTYQTMMKRRSKVFTTLWCSPCSPAFWACPGSPRWFKKCGAWNIHHHLYNCNDYPPHNDDTHIYIQTIPANLKYPSYFLAYYFLISGLMQALVKPPVAAG